MQGRGQIGLAAEQIAQPISQRQVKQPVQPGVPHVGIHEQRTFAGAGQAGGKLALKQWYDDRIGIDLLGPQIAVALAAVFCTLLYAWFLLMSDPSRPKQPV